MRRFQSHTVQLGNILHTQSVKICCRADKTLFHHLLQYRRADAIDVHRLARNKVLQIAQQLRRALRACAAHGCAIHVALHLRSAHWAPFRQMVRHRSLRTPVKVHAHNLRNDLSRFLHDHGVADADILFRDEILVVQRGVGHGRARKAHRFDHRLWRQHTCTAHLHDDIHQLARLLLRRVLIGDCPARYF